ncbi:mechanosensitive ion channel domain-containing protein [Desulfosarcina sp.]|uniref:mechanosensitive ion channel domain-containing protein n=1 Tax=Desulfosarcina sp. TaxID=2027861 RepID=UPI0029BC0B09|nr:mechanosensitive ion channel domain-containing protein [Desulfosarcina sp.]MDX2452097.1 mechanosensitive ion channel [Desulfosarcina sp.]MDX2489890.1 mechanosensitive ion channel [Desulfosarcina sp.]
MELSDLMEKVYTLLTLYGLRVVSAIAIVVIGRWVAKGITRIIERLMLKRKVDETLVSFVSNLGYVAMLAFVIIAALNKLGIQTASFIAVVGAAGLAIGLALQGSLSNFAAGILMIIFRPFKVGDYIEGAGVAGTVEAIQIFTTQLKTPDNKTVIIPNSKISSDNIVNYSTKGTRRVELVFGIAYDDDIDKARQIIMDIIEKDERVFKDPEPIVVLSELADSSVNLTMRAWSKSGDHWNIFFDTTEKVKKAFDAQGITIPFPQRDVHIYEHKTDHIGETYSLDSNQ